MEKHKINTEKKLSEHLFIMAIFIVLAIAGIGFSGSTYPPGTVDMAGELAGTLRLVMITTSIVMGIIVFFPLLFLLRFSNNMRTAINANDQEAMNEAFLNMKRYFRFIGILFIIGLAFYAITIVMLILGSTLG